MLMQYIINITCTKGFFFKKMLSIKSNMSFSFITFQLGT